jgi:hypothetical protein
LTLYPLVHSSPSYPLPLTHRRICEFGFACDYKIPICQFQIGDHLLEDQNSSPISVRVAYSRSFDKK